MDLKFRGKTWVGNVYHKFEAMCHEVDDFVSQDTVKYVGNQVQTVGESMKKFYSDVVQDLLPSSLMDPIKCEEKEVSQNENSATGTYISSMIGIEQEPEDDDMKQLSEKNNSVDALENSQMSSFTGLTISKQIFTAAIADPIGEAESDISFGKEDDALPLKNSDESVEVNIEEEDEEEEQSPLEESSNKEYKDLSEAPLDSESIDESKKNGIPVNVSFDILPDGTGLKSTERERTACKSLLDAIECDSNVPNVLQFTELASSIVSCEDKVAETVLASSSSSLSTDSCYLLEFSCATFPQKTENTCHDPTHASMFFNDLSNVLTSSESSPVIACNKEADMELAFSNGVLSCESNDASRFDGPAAVTGSSVNEHEEFGEHTQLDSFIPSLEIGRADDFTDIADPSLETIDLSDKVKLDESCVLVDSKLLYAVSSRARIHRSYKKLIQDAFASRKRLTKEYEQLAILYGDIDVDCRQPLEQNLSALVPVTSLASKKSPAHDLCDSEWEFL